MSSRSLALRKSGALAAALSAAGITVLGGGLLSGVRAAENPKPALLLLRKGENALAILDPETLKPLGTVATGEGPHEVAVSADGRTAFVANYGNQTPGNSLSVIDIAGRKELRRVDLGALRRPHGLVEAEGKIYFTSEAANAIARYDPVTDKVDWIRGTGQNLSHMLAITPDAEKIYTANIGSDTVTVLERSLGPAGPRTTQIPVGRGPEGIAVSPDGKEVWVGHRGGDIAVIDTATDKVAATIQTRDVILRLAFTPDGTKVLAGDIGSEDIVVYDVAKRHEVQRVQVGEGPGSILVAPDGKRAYVGVLGSNEVAAIDLEKLTVAVRGVSGPIPDGLAWAGVKAAPTVAFKRPGMLGLAAMPLSDEARAANKIAEGVGLLVQAVVPGSAAEAAGVQQGDVLVAIDGQPIKAPADFVAAVTKRRAGDTLTMEFVRKGEPLTLKPTLLPRPRE